MCSLCLFSVVIFIVTAVFIKCFFSLAAQQHNMKLDLIFVLLQFDQLH